MVVPVDPSGGGELDGVDAAPGAAVTDHLAFKSVHRLGQGVVIGVGDAFGVPDGSALRSAIAVCHHMFHGVIAGLSGPDGGSNASGPVAWSRGADAPARDAAGVGIGHQRHLKPIRPGAHVGDVGRPQAVRDQRGESSLHQVSGPLRGRSATVVRLVMPRRTPTTPAARISRSTVHRATVMPSRFMLQPHLPGTVGAVVVLGA